MSPPRGPERFCATCAKVLVPNKTYNRNRKFCSRGCKVRFMHATGQLKNRAGDKAPNWKGGKRVNEHGYVGVYMAQITGEEKYVLEHRLVMEKVLGRKLGKHETVHHKNGVKTDNRPENLELWASRHPRGVRPHESFVMPPGAYC